MRIGTRSGQRATVGWVAAAAALAWGACGGGGGPADPQQTQARIESTVPTLVDDAVDALSTLDDSALWAGVERSLDAFNGAFPSLPFSLPGGTDAAAADGGGSLKRGVRAFALAEAEGEETTGQALARTLVERIFTDANYEGDGVFRLRGADLCPDDPDLGAPDAECVRQLDEAELRLKVELAGDGLDVTFLVGPDRAAPLVLELRSNSVALVIDLGEARAALVHLATVTGQTFELPTVMEGKIALSLTRNGPGDVTIAVAIREAIRIEGTLSEGGAIELATAAKDPLIALRAQRDEQRLTVDVDLGETTFEAPWEQVVADTLATGALAVDCKGLSGSISLEPGATLLRLTNVGLGDGTSTIALDGATLISVDLNADAARRFDVEIRPVAGALPTVTFTPGFDLALGAHLAPLAAAGDAVESFLLDELYRVTFSGDAPTTQSVPPDPLSGFPGALRMVTGQLSISSSAAAAAVIVAQGQCLVGDDAVTDGEHPLLGQLATIACP